MNLSLLRELIRKPARRGFKPGSFRYVLAVLVTSGALALYGALAPVLPPIGPYPFLVLAVAVSAAAGGLRAGLLSIGLGFPAVLYFFVEPRYSWSIADRLTGIQTVIWATLCLLLSLTLVALDRARRREMEKMAPYRIAYQYAEIGIAQVARDGRLLEVNEKLCRMLGHTREELLGRSFEELTHPADLVEERRLLADLETGRQSSYSLEKRYLRRDGQSIWVRLTSSLAPEGANFYRVSVVEDISARKRAEADVASVARFPAENPYPVLRVRADRTLDYCNQSGEFLLTHWGTRPGQPVPAPVSQLVEETLSAGHPRETEIEVADRTFSLLFVPVKGYDYVNIYGKEITESVQARQRLEQSAAEARRMEAALQRWNERLLVLSEAAGRLLGGGDPDETIRDVFRSITRHLKVDTYFHYLVHELPVDGTGGVLRLASYTGIPDEVADQIELLRFGQALCGTVAVRREPMLATWIQQSEDPQVQPLKDLGVRAYACHPLIAGAHLLGTLSFASRERDRFDEDELEFLATFCRYVAMALERKRLEAELRTKVEALAVADRRKDEFLAMLAHELRNPLAPIRYAVQMLRRVGPDEPLLQRHRDVIDRQVTHMARLLDDLLDVSRITRGKIRLQRERLDLRGVADQVLDTLRPSLREHGLELTYDRSVEPLWVDGDFTRLEQVLHNLLVNAVKYTGSGGRIMVVLERHPAEDGEGADVGVIRVRDTGMGIDAEMLPRVFDLFAQADKSLDRSQGGLGIGLTLVRQLVWLHGGSVQVHSEGHGQGSEFTVRLPLVIERSAALRLPEARDSEAIRQTGKVARRVLVVDDNKDAAESLGELIDLWGHAPRLVHDGPAALEEARSFLPEIVLLDIGLPGMDGYEVARRMRAEAGLEGVLLVALTGYGQEEDRRKALEAGFDLHMTKPVDLDRLQGVIDGRGRAEPPSEARLRLVR